MPNKDPEIRRRVQAAWKARNPNYAKEWRAKHPGYQPPCIDVDRRHAWRTVGKMLREGTMSRGACEICGATNVEAHHAFGYARTYATAVWWLCKRHHTEMHIAIRGMQKPPAVQEEQDSRGE